MIDITLGIGGFQVKYKSDKYRNDGGDAFIIEESKGKLKLYNFCQYPDSEEIILEANSYQELVHKFLDLIKEEDYPILQEK